MFDDDFGRRLQQARIAAGYKTPAAAAQRFGWNKNTYKSHENGLRRPQNQEVVRRYARALKADLAFLLTGDVNSRRADTGAEFQPHTQEVTSSASLITLDRGVLISAIEGAVGHLVHMNPNALRSFAESVIELATTLQPRIADVDMTDSIRTAAATAASQFSGQRSQGNNQR